MPGAHFFWIKTGRTFHSPGHGSDLVCRPNPVCSSGPARAQSNRAQGQHSWSSIQPVFLAHPEGIATLRKLNAPEYQRQKNNFSSKCHSENIVVAASSIHICEVYLVNWYLLHISHIVITDDLNSIQKWKEQQRRRFNTYIFATKVNILHSKTSYITRNKTDTRCSTTPLSLDILNYITNFIQIIQVLPFPVHILKQCLCKLYLSEWVHWKWHIGTQKTNR